MKCEQLDQYVTTTVRSFFPPLIIIAALFIVFSLLLLGYFYYGVKTKSLFSKLAKWSVFITIIISVISFLNIISSLNKQFEILRIIPSIEPLSSYVLIIIFPLLFVLYFAWKKEIPLSTRYAVIVSYFIFLVVITPLASIWIFEQIVTNRQLCFGVSCSICNNETSTLVK